MKFSKAVYIAVAAMVLFSISGCATIGRIARDMSRQEVLVKVAVARYLHEHPSHAARVAAITGDALALTDSRQATTVANIREYMIDKLNIDRLIPEERELVLELVDSVQKNVIEGALSDGVPDPGKEMVKARDFLTWLQSVALRESGRIGELQAGQNL